MIKNSRLKKLTAVIAIVVMAFSMMGCGDKGSSSSESSTALESSSAPESSSSAESSAESTPARPTPKQAEMQPDKYKGMTAEQITASLSLEQKAAQMVMACVYKINTKQMQENCYGCILSLTDPLESAEWRKLIDSYQEAALKSDAAIPYIYGQDQVHGVYGCLNAVIFPHSIGLGVANDPELMYEMGKATADESKLCHMIWTYSPVVAQAADPRWGRTYECYGSDLEIIKTLGESYTKGLIDGGLIACAKHFFADGNVEYGTGENSDVERLIDRGDAKLSEDEIKELLSVYQGQIDAGVQSIMISHSALNGIKMHENAKYIQYLKNEMGFKGFVAGDWNSVTNTSAPTYEEQIVNAVNAGLDMLMEVDAYEKVRQTIISAVNDGRISEERVNDAVTRIIRVKMDAGVFDDPLFKNLKTGQSETGSEEYRKLAEKLVEKSLVCIKNENNILPLKEGTKVYITGPAADNAVSQCGGWTMAWNGSPIKDIPGLTTIKKAFLENAAEYGISIADKIEDADVVLLAVGEQAYAEWNGDTEDLELCGSLGLERNKKAIKAAEESSKPVVTLIVAGRNVIIKDYVDKWDAVVMCYLPGSEGKGVSNVICGKAPFTGKLASPWYSDVSQIGTEESWLPVGYGLVTEE